MLLRDAERPLNAKDLPTIVAEVESRMKSAADALDFEQAVLLRDHASSSGAGPRPNRRPGRRNAARNQRQCANAGSLRADRDARDRRPFRASRTPGRSASTS